MTNEIEDLARRAVACKAWRWMPGMLTTDGDRIVSTEGRIASAGLDIDGCVGPSKWDGREVPDFDDAATIGCLEVLAREAWGQRGEWARLKPMTNGRGDAFGWEFMDINWITLAHGHTKAHALVAALEAAPAREVTP